ncbi:MAG: amidohydrolase family protein [Nitrososphaerota archaeon]|nr:amidohydrolase family protein [Nitrososphaerota archaeon]
MIIDSHTHFYGPGLPEVHAKFVSGRLPTIGTDLDHEVDYFVNMMNKNGVDKNLAYCNPNESTAEMIEPHKDRFVPFASVDMKQGKKAAEDLEYVVNSLGFKGIAEQTVASKHFFIDDFELLDPVYKKADDLGAIISWEMQNHFLFGASRQTFLGVERLQEVCFRYPNLKHLICHMGGFANYRTTLSAFSGYKNVYMDISGMTTSAIWRHLTPVWGASAMARYGSYVDPTRSKSGKPSDYEKVIAAATTDAIAAIREAANVIPDRIMFGTDGPFASRPELELEVCRKALGHDKELLAHVLGENARTFLNL